LKSCLKCPNMRPSITSVRFIETSFAEDLMGRWGRYVPYTHLIIIPSYVASLRSFTMTGWSFLIPLDSDSLGRAGSKFVLSKLYLQGVAHCLVHRWSVRLCPLRSRCQVDWHLSQYGIWCAVDLSGKTFVKGKGEGAKEAGRAFKTWCRLNRKSWGERLIVCSTVWSTFCKVSGESLSQNSLWTKCYRTLYNCQD
jgi:hypothetical protein